MLLQILGTPIDVTINDEEHIISRHSGKSLLRFSCNLDVRGAKKKNDLDEFIKLNSEEGIPEIDSHNNMLRRFKIVNSSYSYTLTSNRDEKYMYTIELEEKEELNIQALIIEGQTIEPYNYEERIDNDAIIINTKVKMTDDKLNKVREGVKGKKYFNVVRKGISDEVKQMRYGKVLWSQHDGFIKQDIVLVEKSYDTNDTNDFKGILYPELDNMQHLLVYSNEYLERLTDLLVEKNILSEEEVQKVKQDTEENLSNKFRQLYKVQDIDL